MKNFVLTTMILLGLGILWMPQPLQAQGFFGDYCNGGSFADTLNVVELSGTAVVHQSENAMIYYLDLDGDEQAEYLLSFGPNWYVPDNGNERPDNGDQITVRGFLMSGMLVDMIMVNELNGVEWRSFDGDTGGNWHGFDHWVNGLETITVNGTALVDSSYYYPQYFVDTNADNNPDYYLHFGPVWYEPESGASRPEDGQSITISGGLSSNYMGFASIMVYQINGQHWRDSTGPHPWSGQWVHRDFNDSTWIYCQSDTVSVIGFPQGCFGQGGGMMMFPDSIFCEFEQIHPDFAPGDHDSTLIACYFLDLIDGNGMGRMSSRGYGHGSRRLQGNPLLRLHYSEARLEEYDLSDNRLRLKGFDSSTETWVEISDFTADKSRNLISLNRNKVYHYYAIFAPESGSLGVQELNTGNLNLEVFPNPVRDKLKFSFNLTKPGLVDIQVLSISGKKVAQQTRLDLNSGANNLEIDLRDNSDLKSGVYFIVLSTSQNREVKSFLFK